MSSVREGAKKSDSAGVDPSSSCLLMYAARETHEFHEGIVERQGRDEAAPLAVDASQAHDVKEADCSLRTDSFPWSNHWRDVGRGRIFDPQTLQSALYLSFPAFHLFLF